jgi:hypothetical protein
MPGKFNPLAFALSVLVSGDAFRVADRSDRVEPDALRREPAA